MVDRQNPQASPDDAPPAVKSMNGGSNNGNGGIRIGRVILAPFTLVAYLVRGKRKVDEIVVFSAPRAFFLWFVVGVGFALKFLVPTYLGEGAAAWVYIVAMIFFILALLYDLSLKKLGLWVLIIAVLWLSARYVENLRDVAILGPLLHHFAALEPQYDHGTVTVLSWLLLIPWVCSLFEMRFDRKKKFSPNEIAEFHFGEGSELTDRSGLRFVTKYRDVLETVLGFGGGDLLAVDNHQNVIKRYENIVGLWFLWPKLDRVLHQRATLVDEDDDKEEEKAKDDEPVAP